MGNPFDITDIRNHIFEYCGDPLPADGTYSDKYYRYPIPLWIYKEGDIVKLCYKRRKNGTIQSLYKTPNGVESTYHRSILHFATR